MIRCFFILLLAITQAHAGLLSPADAAQAAARDLLRLPPQDRPFFRYLSLHNFPSEAERIDEWRITSAHVNGLSRESEISVPTAVNVGRDRFAVLKIDARDYSTEPKKWLEQWDKLGKFDTFFHTTVKGTGLATDINPVKERAKRTRDEGGHVWVWLKDDWHLEWRRVGINEWIRGDVTVDDGEPRPGTATVQAAAQVPANKELFGLGPWLVKSPLVGGKLTKEGEAEVKLLTDFVNWTQSVSPILMADWFRRYTAIQEVNRFGGKAPGYYDFLGFKEQSDFEQALGFDIKLMRTTFKRELAGAIRRTSGKKVRHNNARMVQFDKPGGSIYFMLDTEDGTDKKNYLRNLDTNPKAKTFLELVAQEDEFDAVEAFGPLPNGMMAWWLANSKRVRQNNAPDFIASNRLDALYEGTDARVHINMWCIRCHVRGVQPINDYIRQVASRPLELKVPDPLDFQRRKQLYMGDLAQKIRDDQLIYARAVAKATNGLSPERYARLYGERWDAYAETDKGLELISRYAGRRQYEVLKAVQDITRKVGGQDNVLAGLLRSGLKGEQEVPIRPDHFEEIFPVLMTQLMGYTTP